MSCRAQQPPPRQVVIGGQKLPEISLTRENNPLQLLKEKNDKKSSLRCPTEPKQPPYRLFHSSCEPLIADVCIACGTCAIGTCFTSTTFPQAGLMCNCTTNCLVSSILLCYWIHDQPEDITSGQLKASSECIIKLKNLIFSFLGFENENQKPE